MSSAAQLAAIEALKTLITADGPYRVAVVFVSHDDGTQNGCRVAHATAMRGLQLAEPRFEWLDAVHLTHTINALRAVAAELENKIKTGDTTTHEAP